jgi:hypothetical protein
MLLQKGVISEMNTDQNKTAEYSHPAVGKTVIRKNGEKDIVQKVVDSGFGKIAVLKSIAPKGLLLSHCEFVESTR